MGALTILTGLWSNKTVVVIGFLCAALIGLFFYTRLEISVLDNTINKQKLSIQTLDTSNIELGNKITALDLSLTQMAHENAAAQKADAVTNSKIQQVQTQVSSTTRNNRIATVKQSSHSDLLLKDVNKSFNCNMLHVGANC